MGEINLIPGQQVRGQGRAAQAGTGGVEYSRPVDERAPQVPSVRPPKESWWARRQAARAVKQHAKAEAQAAAKLARAQAAATKPAVPPPVAQTAVPKNDFFPVEVDLLADVKKPVAPPPPPPRARPTPAVKSIQAEPDFISDAGFTGTTTTPHTPPPSNEAYYIRRPVKPMADLKPLKHKRKERASDRTQHLPTEPTFSLMDVNLIPKEFGAATKPKHPWSELVRYVIAAVAILGASYGGLRWYDYKLTSDAENLRAQVAVLDQQIATYGVERAQAVALQDKLTGLTTIIDQHIDYAEFFDFIETNTLPSVYYKSLNVDARTGAVTTSAVTSDFDQLRAQVAVLEDNPEVSGVTVNSATRTVPTTPTGEVAPTSTSTLLFSLTFKVDQTVFHP